VDSEGAPILLHNESADRNHWLALRLLSRFGGRDALGARVTIEMAHGKRVAESQTCRSYLSSSDPTVHFGLGPDSTVARFTIRWPDGKVPQRDRIGADHCITIREDNSR